jgi:hypothetical protein
MTNDREAEARAVLAQVRRDEAQAAGMGSGYPDRAAIRAMLAFATSQAGRDVATVYAYEAGRDDGAREMQERITALETQLRIAASNLRACALLAPGADGIAADIDALLAGADARVGKDQ